MNVKFLTIALAFAMAGLFSSAIALAQEKAAQGDDLLIAAQRICPVSGEGLLEMGGPVKAKVGGQTVFLCCKGCLGKPISKENWASITANLAAAQGRCPVMKRPLPEDATSIVVSGRRVFVCCPPCTKKIEADPDKYLAVVNELLAKSVGQHSEE